MRSDTTACLQQRHSDARPSDVLQLVQASLPIRPAGGVVFAETGVGNEGNDSDAWLDIATRRVYGLALAATRIGSVQGAPLHVVLVSSMAVFDAAPDELAIQTNWERRPSTCACTNLAWLDSCMQGPFLNLRCVCTMQQRHNRWHRTWLSSYLSNSRESKQLDLACCGSALCVRCNRNRHKRYDPGLTSWRASTQCVC